jgi:ATP-binding cassette subfamily C protein LapB
MHARPKSRPAAETPAPPPGPPGDPLADALQFLAAHHGRAISREALLAGLPILDGKLPPPLFERAAAKAGLEAKAIRRRLSDIPALVLPAVLSMRDGSTRILLAIDPDTKSASVVDPSVPHPAQLRPLAELAENIGLHSYPSAASAISGR